jgi:lipopolysaccharide transport system permease protein
MVNYFRDIWRCRFFWMSLVRMDLRTRYRRSVLGMGWSLLQPIAMTVILCTVFHQVFDVQRVDYAPYVLAGLVCWNYILGVTVQGCGSIFQGESYIRQYPAPLAIYPLRTVLGAAIHFLIALSVVVALSWYIHGFGNLAALPSLIPTVILLLILGWSLAVLASLTTVYFQDTQHLAEVGFQLLFYATPIIYMEDMLTERRMAWLMHFNPLVILLRLIREPILSARVPDIATFASAVGIVCVAATAAVFMLYRLQRQIIFYL